MPVCMCDSGEPQADVTKLHITCKLYVVGHIVTLLVQLFPFAGIVTATNPV